jgi:hypothetical protein
MLVGEVVETLIQVQVAAVVELLVREDLVVVEMPDLKELQILAVGEEEYLDQVQVELMFPVVPASSSLPILHKNINN